MHQDAFLALVQFGDLGTELIGNERAAVEGDVVAVLFFLADAVGGNQRHQVGTGMALLYALPVLARGDARVMRLTADGRRVKEDFRAHQRHAARALGEPLVPADADADFGVGGIPYLEAGIAGVEVVLLVVTRAVGNVAFPINAEVAPIGVDDRDAVEACPSGAFEEADRQDHLEFRGDLLEVRNGGVLVHRAGQLGVVGVGLLAEIGSFEQFLNKDDLRTLGCGLAYQLLGRGDIGGAIPGAGHLGGGDGNDTRHGAPRCAR